MIDKDKLLEALRHSSQYNAPCPGWVFKKIAAMEDVEPEVKTQISSADCISKQDAIDAINETIARYVPYLTRETNGIPLEVALAIKRLPSAQPKWNNHTVACLLAEMFGDDCACNYNDIDEWLPEKCELLDSCPNPGGVACWEQFLKHRAERRE